MIQKGNTMTMKGGNTDELYADDGRKQMAQSLVDQHPDITTISWKWNRWQHHVDYSGFRRNKLTKRPGIEIPDRVNDYGMVLQRRDEAGWSNIPTGEALSS
jgi:hypothetical protein